MFNRIYICISVILFFVNCPEPDKNSDSTSLLISLLGTRSSGSSVSTTGGTGVGVNNTTSTNPSVFESSTTSEVVAGNSFTVNTVSVTQSQTTVSSFKIVMSTDSTLTDSDTEVGTVNGTNPTTYNIDVPASLVPSNATLPVRYYFGLLPRSSTSANDSIIVFPANSLLSSGNSVTSAPAAISLNGTNTQAFISYFLFNNTTKFTASAYQVSGGLNPSLALIRQSDLTIVGSTINSNGADNFEFASYTSTIGSFGLTVYLRVASVDGTTGSFKPSVFSNGSFGVPFFTSISCSGGTGIFANRCVNYPTEYSGRPASSANCVAIQGTGSIYSASSCTATNRIRRCYANPLNNNGRVVLDFYSPSDTTSTADTLCAGDIAL